MIAIIIGTLITALPAPVVASPMTDCFARYQAFRQATTDEKEIALLDKQYDECTAKASKAAERDQRSGKGGAASADDVDRLTTYATLLGRATGCGINVRDAARRVGHWMDQAFPPGSHGQETYLPVFLEGMKYHAQQQRDGKSPDSCATIKRSFNSFPWP